VADTKEPAANQNLFIAPQALEDAVRQMALRVDLALLNLYPRGREAYAAALDEAIDRLG